MVTKIMIDIDGQYAPVVRISGLDKFSSSDDPRDKLMKGFIERCSERLCAVKHDDQGAYIDTVPIEAVVEFIMERMERAEGDERGEKIAGDLKDYFFGATDQII